MIEYIAVALLAVIAGSELTRLFLTHKKVTKKSHFQQKLEGTQKMTWDMEFKAFKTREIREEIRNECDALKSRLFTLETRVRDWPENSEDPALSADEKKRVEDQIVLVKRDIERMEAQMKGLDIEVNGTAPTEEHRDGVSGIRGDIDSLRELSEMLKSWIARI